MADIATYSLDDVQTVVISEMKTAELFCKPTDHPRAFLLTGQPGAGKTTLSAILGNQCFGDIHLINGDDFRRHHPHYKELHATYGADAVPMTSAFSGAVTESLIEELSNRHFNLIIEGTGRTVEVPARTAELLNSKGYTVRMAVIAARPEFSLAGTMLRFYNMNESGTTPRATAIDAHDNVVKVLPDNLDKLVALPQISGITIWTRERIEIYDSDKERVAPSSALRGFWNHPWTKLEREEAWELLDRLRGCEATQRLGCGDEIAEIGRRFHDAIERSQATQNVQLEDDELDL